MDMRGMAMEPAASALVGGCGASGGWTGQAIDVCVVYAR